MHSNHISQKYRPIPFWGWNDDLKKEELIRQLRELKDKGMGGFFIHSRVGLVTPYLSDEWMQLVEEIVCQAKKQNMDTWLYDEDMWPSGYASGEVPKQSKSFRAHTLLLLLNEEVTQNDAILKTVTCGSAQYQICVRTEPLANPRFNNTCYMDTLNKNAIQAFLASTHEKYKAAIGDEFGRSVQGVFTDEPNYHMHNLYQNPSLPWTEHFLEIFHEKYGYSLYDVLESLFFETRGCQKVRYDFFRCASELFLQNFTIPYKKWCEENHLKFTGHYFGEDSLLSQIRFMGYTMPHYEYMDMPGVDKLERTIHQNVTLKQLSSVAQQLGKKRTLCEIFGCMGQQVSFADRKWVADWAILLGINCINSHLLLYSMRGERKRDYPANLFYQQPWWEEEGQFSEYIGRLCQISAESKAEVNTLVIHPMESIWCTYSAYEDRNGNVKNIEEHDRILNDLTLLLLKEKIDFHFGDEEILSKHARVENGKMIVGEMEYENVILPKCTCLRKSTLALLDQFAETGGNPILAISKLPDMIEGEKRKIELKNTVLYRNASLAVTQLKTHIKAEILITDTLTKQNAQNVWCSHKTNGDEDLFFVINTDPKRETECEIWIHSEKVPYLVDLNSGGYFSVPYQKTDSGIRINGIFAPAGSALFTLSRDTIPCQKKKTFFDCGFSLSDFCANHALAPDQVELSENNVLPLATVSLWLNRKKVAERAHVSHIHHNYFYNMPDGTEFIAQYPFFAEELPDGRLYAAIECADHLKSIEINGKTVLPSENGTYFKDISFRPVDITDYVRQGENQIQICGIKINNVTGIGFHKGLKSANGYRPTEIEAIYLFGNFYVNNIDNQQFTIKKPQKICHYKNITEDGYPFYAGRLKYTFNMSGTGKKAIRLNCASCACAKISINGKEKHVLFTSPFIFEADLTKDKNIVEVEIATTLYNMTGPNWCIHALETTFLRPTDFVREDLYTQRLHFQDFGVSGISVMD